MSTFGEIVYSVLDLMKMSSDDAYYTEEHIIFLAKKMRALLLERKYRGSRNGTFREMSEENKQQICLQLKPAELLPAGCGGNWLMSTAKIPSLMDDSTGVTCTGHDLLFTNVTFVSPERMPYVGYNKWLKNIIYASRSVDGHLYLTSPNPQFIFLEQAGLIGVFDDPEEAAKLSHEACMTGVCDVLEQRFPLEASLVPSCIELIVQELNGSRFAPQDKRNNAKDDFGDLNVQSGNTAPAEREERQAQEQQ